MGDEGAGSLLGAGAGAAGGTLLLPLYPHGVADPSRFALAVHLLNKNIEQLLQVRGGVSGCGGVYKGGGAKEGCSCI